MHLKSLYSLYVILFASLSLANAPLVTPKSFNLLAEHILNKYNDHTLGTQWHVELYKNYLDTMNDSNTHENCSSFSLQEKGLKTKYLDHMAVEYAKLKENTFISVLFQPVCYAPDVALKTISEYGEMVYIKKISLNSNGLYNLLNLIYEVHHTFGWLATFDGIYNRFKTLLQLKDTQHALIVLWECDSLQRSIECKRKLRSLYDNSNNTLCHFTDRHRETLYVSQSLFNQNCLNFLNKAQPGQFKNFTKHIKELQRALQDNPQAKEHYAIDAGAVLAAYNLRDCSDLDVITKVNIDLPSLGINNQTRTKYGFNVDDLIYNPESFFYYKGLRFITLDSVLSYKIKKSSSKDIRDVALINTYLAK
jgi:hypothetical protein